MKNLVIVESAAKSVTIQKYLNEIPSLREMGSFTVMASLGHVTDLPPKTLGVDKVTWTAEYEPLDGKRGVITKLRAAVKAADRVFLASDPDLEGESISQHLVSVLKLKNPLRITFQEITKNALEHAIRHPRAIDTRKVAAQETRRVVDRVVGYELSPLLWREFVNDDVKGLSAGRVQSVALKMICARTVAAKAHLAQRLHPYWTIEGTFQTETCGLEATSNAVASIEEAKQVLVSLGTGCGADGWRCASTQKEVRKAPPAPFTTSTLQQEAYNALGLNAKRTMQVAQELYEGGHITYMRTDSTAFAEEAQGAMLRMIAANYGEDMAKGRAYKARAANAQEAHEAIRPTQFDVRMPPALEGVAQKLYDLIWRRAVASQMAAAVYREMHYTLTHPKTDLVFTGTTSVLVSEGYLAVARTPVAKATGTPFAAIADTSATARAFRATADVQRPTPLYNEPMLVKALEKEGIGRPSTYATILEKLTAKGYVVKDRPPSKSVKTKSLALSLTKPFDIVEEPVEIEVGGKDKDKLVPTDIGERIVAYLENVMPSLLDVGFTASMEAQMDAISAGSTDKCTVLNQFYKPFSAAIAAAPAPAPRAARSVGSTAPHVRKTKYGPAVFDPATNRFVSLEPFLQWRGMKAEQVGDADVAFLLRFPIRLAGTTRTIEWGRYGIYVKDGEKNLFLAKQHWDNVYDGTITTHVVDAATGKKSG